MSYRRQYDVALVCLINVAVLLICCSDANGRTLDHHKHSKHLFVNVEDFRRQINENDDTKAFVKAWQVVCDTTNGTLVVPAGYTYTLKPITFSGPCKPITSVQIFGNVEASRDKSDYDEDRNHWLVFKDIDQLIVTGTGIIDGKGERWWRNSCKVDKSKPCRDAPTALTFEKVTNLQVTEIRVNNAQQMHMSFDKCKHVRANSVHISSPGESPNTDGIHVTGSSDVRIHEANIATGDDCISIVSGSSDIVATHITCGPGHGISIGSLGEKNSKATVTDVTIDGAKLFGTTNGVRIKSWPGGKGYATNIVFHDIKMTNVSNPIIIDQNYCDQSKPCKKQKSAVQVENVRYSNIRGTSYTDVAVKFDCSKAYPCKDIKLIEINLIRDGGHKTKADCQNIRIKKAVTVYPHC